MAKVKRGRPRGEATKSQPIRMPVRLLEQVRKEAATRGHSVTQIIVEKLEADYAPEPGFEPHARDLMILLELVIRSFSPMTDEHGKPLAEWWTSPFAVQAVLLAFADVVSAVGPRGDVKPPELRGDWSPIEAETYKSPAARAAIMAQMVLQQYRDAQQPDRKMLGRADEAAKLGYGRAMYERLARDGRLADMRKRWRSATRA